MDLWGINSLFPLLLLVHMLITLFVEIFARTYFRALLALRENWKFSHVFILAHLQVLRFQKRNLIYGNTNEKQGIGFAKIYLGFFLCAKLNEEI